MTSIQPSMVTHTQNCALHFIHPKWTHTVVNTHTPWTHTQRGGHPFMLWRPGSSWGFGALLKGTSSWYWRWRECCTFTPPLTNPAGPRFKHATFQLWVQLSTIRPRLPTTLWDYAKNRPAHWESSRWSRLANPGLLWRFILCSSRAD